MLGLFHNGRTFAIRILFHDSPPEPTALGHDRRSRVFYRQKIPLETVENEIMLALASLVDANDGPARIAIPQILLVESFRL